MTLPSRLALCVLLILALAPPVAAAEAMSRGGDGFGTAADGPDRGGDFRDRGDSDGDAFRSFPRGTPPVPNGLAARVADDAVADILDDHHEVWRLQCGGPYIVTASLDANGDIIEDTIEVTCADDSR